MLQNYDWLYDQYIIQDKPATVIAKEIGVSVFLVLKYLGLQNIDIKYNLRYSYICIQWLESIIQQEQIFIQHAGNIGEYKIPNTRYRVDGYCIQTNTVYEFHGDCFHGNPHIYKPDAQCNPYSRLPALALYQKTIDREQHIRELGYNLVVMWEQDYNNQLKLRSEQQDERN